MKICYLAITLISITISAVWADNHNNSGEIDFLYGFLEGSYDLIGRLPDSNITYTGKMVLRKIDGKLEVIRRIEGKEIKCVGKIEMATADKIKVLRIRFADQNKNYEVTYLMDSDFNNYGRLTGYLYLKGGGTKIPGLEALFINHQAFE